jgi:acetyl esterase/lipase
VVLAYGVYDFTDRFGHWPHRDFQRFLRWVVLRSVHPEQYADLSPIDRLHADAPPMLLIHGTHDSLVPVQESREFFAAASKVVRARCVYAEIEGGQHALDIFHSPRAAAAVVGIRQFVERVRVHKAAAVAPARARPW